MNILVIDDEKDIRDNISSILKKMGYNLITIDNVVDATELILTKEWGIIISDIMIPHLGGFELVELAKRVSPATPVIVISGLEKDILFSTRTKADAVLTKPFTSKQLLDEVFRLSKKNSSKTE